MDGRVRVGFSQAEACHAMRTRLLLGPMNLCVEQDLHPEGEWLNADGVAPVIVRGWPLPIEFERGREAQFTAAESYRFPLTHQTYRLVRWWRVGCFYTDDPHYYSNGRFLYYASIDVLFVLTILALILFLQIPRRKVAAREGRT